MDIINKQKIFLLCMLIIVFIGFIIYLVIKNIDSNEKVNRHKLFRSLDKSNIIVLTTLFLLIVITFINIIYTNYPIKNSELAFYNHISEVNFDEFETNLLEKYDKKDKPIRVYEKLVIYTDNNGNIYDVSFILLVHKRGTYRYIKAEFDDQSNTIIFNEYDTALEEWIDHYETISEFLIDFKRVNLNKIYQYLNLENYYFDLKFELYYDNQFFEQMFLQSPTLIINQNGDMQSPTKIYDEEIGVLAITKIRILLNGTEHFHSNLVFYMINE